MTATKSNNKTGDIPRLVRSLASVRLAIVTLSLIAATSVVGSLIRQGATEEEYLASYPEKTYHLIKLLGLDDAYHSTWFYFLLGVFALNLVMCTFRRFSALKGNRRDRTIPDIEQAIASGAGFRTGLENAEAIDRRLKNYKKKQLSESAFLFERGHFSKYGVIVIHASILMILAGALVGSLWGYKGFVALRQGEETRLALSRQNAHGRITLPFAIRCIDFRASFYPGGQPKEYASDVEIIDRGMTVVRKTIRVNQPLSYGGIQVYQSSYGKSNTYTFLVDGKTVEIGDDEVVAGAKVPFMVVRYEAQVHNFGPGVMVAYMDGDQPKTVWFLSDVEQMRDHVINGSHIGLRKIDSRLYTGLEVSHDPGIPLVLAGFVLMLAGLYMNFFLFHRRIYVVHGTTDVRVAGYASRNKQALNDEMMRISGGLAR